MQLRLFVKKGGKNAAFFMFYNIFCNFFCQKIWSCQIKAVPLHQKSEKGHNILRWKRRGQRWGATLEEYTGVKHIPQMCGRKAETLIRFRGLCFSLLIMKPTYIQLWLIIFDTLKLLVRWLSQMCKESNHDYENTQM